MVNGTLGLFNDAGPVSTPERGGITCTYSQVGVDQVTIEFRPATAAAFTTGENANVRAGVATAVSGLGDQAYVLFHDINVLKGSTSVEIIAPLNTTAELEALAHLIVD